MPENCKINECEQRLLNAKIEHLAAENARLQAIELAAVRCVEDGNLSKLMTALSLNQQQEDKT